MSNCEQNCEAVANLNEYAANLIGYSKLINAWLNGPQDGVVDIGGVPTPTLRNLVMALKFLTINPFVQDGGGIGIDADGKMFVDFSLMPTDKFEKLLQQIRVPIWLSANTTFYVNNSHPNASDSLENPNRGKTPDLPFMTIQAAVTYVVNNYNMVNFVAIIRVAAGTYNENLSLGEFSHTTGSVHITSYEGEYNQATINTSGLIGINCTGGPYLISNLKIKYRPVYDNPIFNTLSLCFIQLKGELNIRSCKFEMTDYTGLGQNSNYDLRMFNTSGGKLNFTPSLAGESRTSLTFDKTAKSMYVIFGEQNAQISTSTSAINQSVATIDCSGNCSYFLGLSNSSCTRIGQNFSMNFNDLGVTGKKYYLTNGSKCITYGYGQDWLPGNEAGIVESSTYCFYN